MLLLDGKQFNKYLYFGRSLYCFILTFYNIEAVEDFLGASQTEVKKITRLVIVFGGHEVLLQNYWMESWLEWAFVSPILELDYELPSRETGGNKHRPKIVLSNAMQCSAFQILPGTQNARRRHWWLHPEDNATLIGFYPALFISCRILRLALYKSHFQIGNPANGQLPLIAILLRQEMNNEINF